MADRRVPVDSVPTESPMGRRELIGLLSTMMAMAGVSVGLILPTFEEIRREFGLPSDSDRTAGLVTFYILGLALGTMVFGPLADQLGRKRALYAGYVLYAVGAAASAMGPSLEVMFVTQLLWGIGGAGPRTIALAIVRDLYDGDSISRVLSTIWGLFIIGSIAAPGIGTVIVSVTSWQWVFAFASLMSVATALWTTRLGETLAVERRLKRSVADVLGAARSVFGNRQATWYMVAMTVSSGGWISFSATSELIVDDVYASRALFPYIFGGITAVTGVVMILNAMIVERVGMRRVLTLVLLAYVPAGGLFLVGTLVAGGEPSLGFFIVGLSVVFGLHSVFMPNANSMAMEPLAQVAGTAAAIIASVSIAGGAILGAVIDRTFDGTVTPLAAGVALSGLGGMVMVLVAGRGKLPDRVVSGAG